MNASSWTCLLYTSNLVPLRPPLGIDHVYHRHGRSELLGLYPVSYTHLDVYKRQLLAYIQEKLDDLSKQRAELEKTVSQCEIVDNQNVIKDLKRQLQQIQNHIDTAISKGHCIMSKIYDLNGKLSECETVIHNFFYPPSTISIRYT